MRTWIALALAVLALVTGFVAGYWFRAEASVRRGAVHTRPGSAAPAPRRDAAGSSSVAAVKPLGLDVGVVLVGVVREPDGARVAGAAIATVDAHGNERTVLTDATGAYALAGLPSGAYRAVCTKPGYADARTELDLPGRAAPVRLDFTLRRARSIRVIALDTAGEPLAGMLRKPGERGWAPALYAIATASPPAAVVPVAHYVAAPRFGVGHFTRRLTDADRGAKGAIGHLRVFAAAPVHVSLVARNAVLATKPLDASAEQIVFRVARDTLRAAFVEVTLRVVDDAGRRDASALGALYDGGGSPPYVQADKNGVVRITGELPGRRMLLVYSNQRNVSRRFVLNLQPGERRDLGTVTIPSTTIVTGKVFGPDGAEVRCHLRGYHADTVPSHVPFAIGGTGAQNHPGRGFKLWVRPGRYVLLAASLDRDKGPWGIVPVVLEVGSESLTDVRIDLRAGTPVVLEPRVSWSDRLVLTVRRADGLALWSDNVDGPRLKRVRLVPGPYVAELRDDARVLRRVPFEVGADQVLVTIPGKP